jgi:hypothetical protein
MELGAQRHQLKPLDERMLTVTLQELKLKRVQQDQRYLLPGSDAPSYLRNDLIKAAPRRFSPTRSVGVSSCDGW